MLRLASQTVALLSAFSLMSACSREITDQRVTSDGRTVTVSSAIADAKVEYEIGEYVSLQGYAVDYTSAPLTFKNFNSYKSVSPLTAAGMRYAVGWVSEEAWAHYKQEYLGKRRCQRSFWQQNRRAFFAVSENILAPKISIPDARKAKRFRVEGSRLKLRSGYFLGTLPVGINANFDYEILFVHKLKFED